MLVEAVELKVMLVQMVQEVTVEAVQAPQQQLVPMEQQTQAVAQVRG
jgi:hypothetical protein